MALKLYRAEHTIVYYLLAEEGSEQEEANRNWRQVARDEGFPDVIVQEVTNARLAMDSDDPEEELVYGDTSGDITVAEAFEMSTGVPYNEAWEEVQREFKVMREAHEKG